MLKLLRDIRSILSEFPHLLLTRAPLSIRATTVSKSLQEYCTVVEEMLLWLAGSSTWLSNAEIRLRHPTGTRSLNSGVEDTVHGGQKTRMTARLAVMKMTISKITEA
jgi:hypothetical protein